MRKRNRWVAAALAAAIVCIQVMGVTAPAAASGNVETATKVTWDGPTVYIDSTSEIPWNSIQGSIAFDSSYKVVDHGLVDEFSQAVSDQGRFGIPTYNLMDGEFLYAAAYSSLSDEGVDYQGHVFFITFEEVTFPITITVKDISGNVLETVTVDGSTQEPVSETPEPAATKKPEETPLPKLEFSGPVKTVRMIVNGIAVIELLAVAAGIVTALVSIKKSRSMDKKTKQNK